MRTAALLLACAAALTTTTTSTAVASEVKLTEVSKSPVESEWSSDEEFQSYLEDKYEGVAKVGKVDIVARDGVKLSTEVLVPLHLEKPFRKFPAVIDRSPYGHTGTELIADIYLPFGYATLCQDFRGTHDSGGNFSLWHTAKNDTADTIDWIRKQTWSDGRVFTVGASADGIASLLVPLDPTTKLSGQFIIWATASAYDTIYPGGAYRAALIDNWLKGTVKHQAPGLIELVRTKESYLDEWWRPVEVNHKWDVINAPAVFWAGWYDIFLRGTLFGFNGYQHETTAAIAGKSYLVVDPLGHCQEAAGNFHGDLIFGRVILPILLSYQLFNNTDVPAPAEEVKAVTFYVMGPNYLFAPHTGNYWTSLPDWPTATPTKYFMTEAGSLSTTKPVSGASTFKYDPSHPTPTIGGNNLEIACGPSDQRPLENRSDVLVFTTPVLEEDLAVTGALNAILYVSTANANDTDWVVRLTDVYPELHGGGSHLIQDGIMRMRWRDTKTIRDPQPIVPNQVDKVTISLWNTSYVFNKGHRVRVTISSANSPRFSTNDNRGLPLARDNQTIPTQYIVAENTVHLGDGNNASYLELPVVSIDDMPNVDITSAVKRTLNEMAGGDDDKATELQDAFVRYADAMATRI